MATAVFMGVCVAGMLILLWFLFQWVREASAAAAATC